MKTFNISVSDTSYSTKPTKSDYRRMEVQTKKVDITTLSDYISKGYSICSEFNLNRLKLKDKTNENYKQSNLIVLDFDHSIISFEEALSSIRIKPTIGYKTFSNTDTDYRFKLIYLFEEPISNIIEHKMKSLMIYYLIFNQKEFDLIKPSFDSTCISPVQLFNGTNQRVELFDTIISLDSINQLFEFSEEKFNTYDEVFELLGLNNMFNEFQVESISNQSNNSTIINEVSHQGKSVENINHYTDFFCFPSMGQSYNNINNSFYFRKNSYNNFHTAFVAENEIDQVYFFVGDQHIYSLTTYFKNGKIGDTRRHKTLLYIALVVRNIYPDSEDKVLYHVLRRYVDTYFIEPERIDNAIIMRMVRKVINNKYMNNAGKRYYLFNPRFSSLSKKEKLIALHKIRAQRNKEYILSSFDCNKSVIENSKLIGKSVKTIRKYLREEGLDIVIQSTKVDNYQKFLQFYLIEENRGLSIRKLAKLCGISKSQTQRYIKKYENNQLFIQYEL